MLVTTLAVVVAYLLGSISGSLLAGRFRGVDIRRQGSGNAGGTNAFRTQGALFALAVVIIDIGKGALAAGWVPLLVTKMIASTTSVDPLSLSLLCGFAAVLGHVFPVYHGFSGGKGAGTFLGVLTVTMPIAIAPVVAVWLLVLVLSGYVSLSTLLSALSFVPLSYYMAGEVSEVTWVLFAGASAVFMLFTHRSNIQRLYSGTEYCFTRAKILRR